MTRDLLVGLLWAVSAGTIGWTAAGLLLSLKFEKVQKRTAALPVMFRVLMPLCGITMPLVRRPGMSKVAESTDRKLIQGGVDETIDAETYLSLSILHAIALSLFGLIFVAAPGSFYKLFGLFLMIYGFLFPQTWLRIVIRKRHSEIQRALPNVLDLLTLSVEAGRDFLTALQDILASRDDDALSVELRRVFRETQLGKTRREALRALAHRVGHPDLSSVVDALVQADELGVSIANILRVLGDQMRQKRYFIAEKKANEAPTKLLFPLILFIFPAVLITVLAPILIYYGQQFR